MKYKITIAVLIIILPAVFFSNLPVLADEEQGASLIEKAGDIVAETVKVPLKLVEGVLGFDLGKIVVTPTKYEKYLKDTTVSATVVDTIDFKKGVYYNVSQPLDKVNSVRVERYGSPGQSASVVIRGFTGGRNLVLIDGSPYNAPSLGEADISKIPLKKVERIEVVRGPYSSLYGADAVGGVVNIITKPVPKNTLMDVSYSLGSWNTHNLTIENGSTYGKVGYNLTADYLFTDGERESSDHNAIDLSSKLKLDVSDGIDYTVYANYYTARTEHPGVRPALEYENRTGIQNKLGNCDISSLFDYSRTNRLHINSTLNIKNFTANHYFLHWNDDDHAETYNTSNQRLINDDEFMTYTYGMEYKYSQPIMDIDILTIGSSFLRKVFKVKTHDFNEDTVTHTFGGRDSVRREWAIYAENELNLHPFTFVVGIRRDDPSDYKIRWSRKISGMVDLGFDTKIRSSYGRAYGAPTLNDINWPQEMWVEGNANLNPEKTESWEIGAEKVFGELALLRGTFFRQSVRDAIVWAPTGSTNDWGYARWAPTNLNRLSTKGLELESRFNIFKCFEVDLGYTYLDPIEVVEINSTPPNESRRPASYIPKHKFNGNTQWHDSFGITGLTLGSSLAFISERRNYYGTPPEKKVLDHYFVWDAKATYNYRNLEAFFAINNIMDEGYAKFGSTVDDRGYPQEGLSVTGGVTVSY